MAIVKSKLLKQLKKSYPNFSLNDLSKLVDIILNEIKRAGIDNNLTYGVVLTGGGSQLRNIVALANDLLDMPIRLGRPINHLLGNKDFADEPVHSTILGLLLWPLFSTEKKNIQQSTMSFFESIKRMFKNFF